jgi:phi LC3 family holin
MVAFIPQLVRKLKKGTEKNMEKPMKKKINWMVRLKNPTFIILVIFTIVPQLLQVALPEVLSQYNQVLDIITYVCGILGITIDPTTKGLKDSVRALSYKDPK